MDRVHSFRKLNPFAQDVVKRKGLRPGICSSGQRCYFRGAEEDQTRGPWNIVFLNSLILECTFLSAGLPDGPFTLSFKDSRRDYHVDGRFTGGLPDGDFEISDVRFLRAAEENLSEGELEKRRPSKVDTIYCGRVFVDIGDLKRRAAEKWNRAKRSRSRDVGPLVKAVPLSFSFIPHGHGEWRRETFDDHRNPRGQSRGRNVSCYCGQFQKSLFHGFGIYRDSKMTFNGTWRLQRPHGSGTFVDHLSGTTSVGNWVDGELVGQGTMLYPFSGAEIAGIWRPGGVIASGLKDDVEDKQHSMIPLLEQKVNLARLDSLCDERDGSLLDEALVVSPCNVWLGYLYAKRAVVADAVAKLAFRTGEPAEKFGLTEFDRVFRAPDCPLVILTDDFAAFFRTQFVGDLKTLYGGEGIEAVAAVARWQVFQFISAMVRVIFLEMVGNQPVQFVLRAHDLAEFALVVVVADLTLEAVGDCLFGLYESEGYSSPEGLRFAFNAKMRLGTSRKRLQDLFPDSLQFRWFRPSIRTLGRLRSGHSVRGIMKVFHDCVRSLPSNVEGSTLDAAIGYCLLKSGINLRAISDYLSDWVCTKWIENGVERRTKNFSLVRKVMDRLVSILKSNSDPDIVWESGPLWEESVEKLLDFVDKNPNIEVTWLIDLFAVLSLEVSTHKRKGDVFIQKALILKESEYPKLTSLLSESGVGDSLQQVNGFLQQLSQTRSNHTGIRKIAIRTRRTETVPERHVCVWTSRMLPGDAFHWMAVRIEKFVLERASRRASSVLKSRGDVPDEF